MKAIKVLVSCFVVLFHHLSPVSSQVSSQDDPSIASFNCDGNGGLYFPANEPCSVTFYSYLDSNVTIDNRCTGISGNESYEILGKEDAYSWPDLCLMYDPIRCYSISEYGDLLLNWGGSDVLDDIEKGDFVVANRTTHMLVNCTIYSEEEGGIYEEEAKALSTGALAGIIIGAILFVGAFGVFLCFCCETEQSCNYL